MVDVSHEFVAEKLWLVVAIVTLPLTSLVAVSGAVLPEVLAELLVTSIPIVGWFLLTPLLLFFGEEIADWLVGTDADTVDADGEPADRSDDPVESLKRRYAAGEIGEAEFERRLDRLLSQGDGEATVDGRDAPLSDDRAGELSTEDEDLLERE
ncbi:SHOCT domain-containing protein [Natronoarchaeum rubrum]|uniref:SHOCT domain-containing protein n=1 Tax=Natronoarchaeum rubrum TaxID=755311 RepID=UPI002111F641|nr:SHOCT domain-containing protein [Natronoarchaeum rubrum]